MAICPSCGNNIKQNAKFCNHCGFKIAPPEQVSNSAVVQAQSVSQKTVPSINHNKVNETVEERSQLISERDILQEQVSTLSDHLSALEKENSNIAEALASQTSQSAIEKSLFDKYAHEDQELNNKLALILSEKEKGEGEISRVTELLANEQKQRNELQTQINQEKEANKGTREEIAKQRELLRKERESFETLLSDEKAKLENKKTLFGEQQEEFNANRQSVEANLKSQSEKLKSDIEQLKKNSEFEKNAIELERRKFRDEIQSSQRSLSNERKAIESLKRYIKRGRPNIPFLIAFGFLGLIVGTSFGLFVLPFRPFKQSRSPSGTISIESAPSGAQVSVEMFPHLIGQTPLRSFAIPAGEYNLNIEREGYIPLAQSIRVEPGKELKINNLTLSSTSTPILTQQETTKTVLNEPSGTITVDSKPEGAIVTLANSGSRLGVTPLNDINLTPGTHRLVFSKTGFQASYLKINILKGENLKLGVVELSSLDKAGEQKTRKPSGANPREPMKGVVTVKMGAAWGYMVVDGGSQIESGPVKSLELSPGIHTVRISPRGEGWQSYNVTVKAGETVNVGH